MRRTHHLIGIEPLEERLLLSGLTGQYFDRVDFTDLKLTRVDSTVSFNYGTGSPTPSMGVDNFSIRWTGQVQPQYTQNYTFYATSDDGVRLWVDGRLLIDNWVTQAPTEKSATIPLTAGKKYDIRVDYYEANNTAQVSLSWSSPSQPKQIIPSSALFPSPAGLDATFYENTDFTGHSDTRIDSQVNYAWGTGSPDPAGGIAAGPFSATWTGQITPLYNETYNFFVTPSAGSTAQLYVDRQLIFDSNSVQPGGEIQLEAGKAYDIVLKYADTSGSASLKLEWSSPSQTRQVIPTTNETASKVDAIPTRQPTYTNTVNDNDRPDPGVLFDGGYYWMTHTTGGPSSGWPLSKSTDMLSWSSASNMLTNTNRPAFMDNGSFWAPEFHKINGTYVITGTANSTQYGSHTVIAMATAPEITGPYTVRSTPIVAYSTLGVLDSTIFQDADGKVYLIWKQQSASGTPSNGSIRMHQLDPANLTQFLAGTSEVILLNNAGGGAWEKNIEEAPEMIHHGAYYYLFYSGANIDTTYAVGVARSATLTGTYTRYPGNVPILQSNSTWGGPGHGSFVQDVDGTWWFYYHARHQDDPSFGRVQMLDKVIWTSTGWPTFGNGGTPSTTAQIGPRVNAASGAGLYTIAPAGSAETIKLVRDSTDASLLDVIVNGVTQLSAPYDQIQGLTLNGTAGNDTLTLDYSRGDVIPGAGISFPSSTGADTIQIIGASSTDPFHLTPGRLTLNTGSITYSATDSLILQTGAYSIDADLNNIPVQAIGSATSLIFNTPTEHLASLTLTNASATLTSTTLTANTFSLTSISTLDIAAGKLFVTTSSMPLATLLPYIRSAYDNGHWDAPGITDSLALSNYLALGYATSAQGTQASIPAGFTLIEPTVPGDADLSGTADFNDFLTIQNSFNKPAYWPSGDFDYTGSVDFNDFLLLQNNFNHTAVLPTASPAMLNLTTNNSLFSDRQDPRHKHHQ